MQVTLETGAIKELSEQSNCSVLQGTKVGSAKEHDQVHIKSPESGSAKQYIPLQANYQISRKLSILCRSQYFPSSNTYILNKHPRQSWPKDCSPAVYQYSKEFLPRHSSKLPRRVQSSFPRKVGIHISPSSKLTPSKFWKLILTEHERVVRLYLKSYFLNRI